MPATPYPGVTGPSDQTLSLAESVDSSVNYYFESVEVPYNPKTGAALYQRPGSKAFGAVPATIPQAGRAMIQFDGNGVPDGAIFGVSGDTFWQMAPDGTQTAIGTVVDDGKPAYIAVNAAAVGQVFVASGGHGYCLSSGTFAEIPIGADFFGARDVTFIDGYFVVLSLTVNNQQFQISALNDGTNWTGSDVGLLLGQSDPLQRVLANIEYLAFIGTRRGQNWYNNGAALFPFTIEAGAFLEIGTNAPGSVCKASNAQSTSVYWIGQSARGAAVCERAFGLQTERVSNHAVEAAWASYSTVDDVIGYPINWNGHSLVRFIFPTAGTGWEYDITQSAASGFAVWNEITFTDTDGVQHAPFERAHCYAFGKHLLLSGADSGTPGVVYEVDQNTYMDAQDSPYGTFAGVPTGVVGILTNPVVAADVTWILVGGTFPTGVDFYFTMGTIPGSGEICQCTDATNTAPGLWTLTVTRGLFGTVAQDWSASSILTLVTLPAVPFPGFPITRDRKFRLPWNNGLRTILDRFEVFVQSGVGVSASNTDFSAVCTAGNDTVLVADTTGLAVGQFVTGQPVAYPAQPQILAIVANTSVQFDQVSLLTGTYVITAISQIAGANPVMSLRLSVDGGQNYGTAQTVPMGAIGQTTTKLRWNRQGPYVDGAIWLRVTDPVFSAIVGGALAIRKLGA